MRVEIGVASEDRIGWFSAEFEDLSGPFRLSRTVRKMMSEQRSKWDKALA